MLCWISRLGGLLIMMGHHSRSEALFYYFRLEDQIPQPARVVIATTSRQRNDGSERFRYKLVAQAVPSDDCSIGRHARCEG